MITSFGIYCRSFGRDADADLALHLGTTSILFFFVSFSNSFSIRLKYTYLLINTNKTYFLFVSTYIFGIIEIYYLMSFNFI